MKAMKLSQWLEIKSPTYEVLQIIPHGGDRNYNSSSIAKMVSDMYRSIVKSIKRIEKKLIVETSVKCSYMIDIRKDSVTFYFIVPRQYKSIAKDKITSVWPKCTIEEGKEIEQFTQNAVTTYQLAYKKLDGFSLSVDKKSNASLNHMLNVIDIMESDDRVAVMYNFMPTQQKGWDNKCRHDIDKYQRNEPINKEFGWEHVGKGILNALCTVIDSILNGLDSQIAKGSPLDQFAQYIKTNKAELSEATKKKRFDTVLDTQIVVLSASHDKERATNNAVSVCQSYRALEGDNELMYKKVKQKNINLLDTKLKGVETIKVSSNECHNFLQLPGRELLEQHRIDHINVLETKVAEELLQGYIKMGKSTYKGNTVQTYTCADREIANLPLVFVGPMGAGKTFQNLQYSKDAIAAGEGLICIDYIKNCDLAEEIRRITPPDRLIDLDLSEEECLQAFAYNEFKIHGDTPFAKMECANNHQQAIVELIDAVAVGDPLSGQMRKYLTAAADVVLINDGMSLKDVIRCLESHIAREEFISKIPPEFMIYLDDQVETLKQLDDIKEYKEEVTDPTTGQKTKTTRREVEGTKYSKVEHIMDRVNCLRESLRMKLMYAKPVTGNLDFTKAMDEGKVILIKMPSKAFRSEHVKNVLVTFFVSKIWLACNMRSEQKELRRCHVLLDEIFQAPTAYEPLRKILKQCRKFRLRLVFTAQMLGDLKELNDGLKSAGASYVLMQKADKENFEYLKQEFIKYGFTLDDMLNLKRYHALNLITHSEGYCAYVADLTVKS